MKKIIVAALLALLALNLCLYACAEGSVCIGKDGSVSFEHNYSMGVCTDCGFEFSDCTHENAVPAGESFEMLEKLGAEGHGRLSFSSDTYGFCTDCRCILSDGEACDAPESAYSYEYGIQEHSMENSVCLECGYIQVGCFKKY